MDCFSQQERVTADLHDLPELEAEIRARGRRQRNIPSFLQLALGLVGTKGVATILEISRPSQRIHRV